MSEDNNSGAEAASSAWIDSLRRISWGILALLALVVVLGTIFTAQFAHSQRDTALRINLAGKQRMLSQKIAFLAGQLLEESNAASRPALLAELGEAVTALETSHRGLIDGNAELGLRPSGDPDVRARYHGGSSPLDEVVPEYLKHARAIAQHAPSAPRAQAAFAEIQNRRLPLLRALDELVGEMEDAGRDGVRLIEIAVYVNSGVMLALILFLTTRVYRQLLRRVQSQFDDLQQLNAKLEDRVVERTHELALNERAFSAAKNGIVITDAQKNNVVTYCNPAVCRMLRCEAEDILGHGLEFTHGEDTNPESLKKIQEAIAAGRECSVTLVNYRRDGESFWNEILISPVHDESGRLTHFISIQSDVSERKQLEADSAARSKLNEARAEIADALSLGGDARESLQQVADILSRQLSAQVWIWTLNQREEMLELEAWTGGDGGPAGSHDRMPLRGNRIGIVASECKAYVSNDAAGDSGLAEFVLADQAEMNAFAGLPIEIGDRPLGVMAIFAAGPLPEEIVADLTPTTDALAQFLLRKGTESKLRWSRESLALAVEGAQLGTWHWDIENGSLEWSDRCREVFAIPPGETMSYERFLEAVHPEDRERVDHDVRQTLEDRTQYEVEFRSLWPDGSVRWIAALGRGYYNESGEAVRMEGVVEDITAKKAIRTRLESREAGIRRLYEITAATVDFEDAMKSALAAGCEIFGLETGLLSFVADERCVIQQAHGPTAPELRPGADIPLKETLCSAVLKQDSPLLFHDVGETNWAEHPACQKFGIRSFTGATIRTRSQVYGVVSFCSQRARTSPFTDADADLLALLAVWVGNVLEYYRSQSRLQAAREEADRANQAKSEFLSRMSHELRTPLNGILGFAQLLEIADLPERQKRSAQRINKAGRHLLDLINEVLDLARVESGRLTTSLEPVNLLEAIQDAKDLLKPQAAERNITIEVADAGADPKLLVLADRQRVKQVLLNLGGNAVKYNREGGRIRFDWEQRSGSVIRIHVRDTGPGIPDDMVERIFVPFERAGAEHTEVEGTGLGLALTRHLVNAMKGRIGVESEVGEGSCFWFELTEASRKPIRPEEPANTAPPEDSGAGARPITVLYIEDNLENVRLIEEVLALRPHVQLVTAMQASIGLQLAIDRQPELIFLDLHLPDENGDVVLEKLQASPLTRDIPVVMLTADAMRRQELRLLAAGAKEYVTKPIEVQKILRILDELPDSRTSPQAS